MTYFMRICAMVSYGEELNCVWFWQHFDIALLCSGHCSVRWCAMEGKESLWYGCIALCELVSYYDICYCTVECWVQDITMLYCEVVCYGGKGVTRHISLLPGSSWNGFHRRPWDITWILGLHTINLKINPDNPVEGDCVSLMWTRTDYRRR